ncbi:MAG: ABC transporter permease [Bacteroidetes bacterium]|nr:ABC transporter permease [Bacteroidota bacterium]MCA6442774.1 ABC transporter permease [Bacteroidota bacterium]
MSIEKLIADKITNSKTQSNAISKPIVKIGTIGVIIGVSVMILTLGVVLGFKKEIINKITDLTSHIIISNINLNTSNEPEPIVMSQDSLNILKKYSLIKHLQPTSIKNAILKTNSVNEGVVIKGVDAAYDFGLINANMLEGEIPVFSKDSISKEVVISASLASKLQIKLNEKFTVYFIIQRLSYDSSLSANVLKSEQRTRVFKVKGIFKNTFAEFDENLIFADLKQLQKVNYWSQEAVGAYEIKVADYNQLESNTETLQEFFGYSYSVANVKQIYANIFVWLDKLDVNGIIIIVLMILVATINMITALLILILERTNMIGMLKSLGMSNANVRKVFVRVSLNLILKGLIWGNLIGLTLCYIQKFWKPIKLNSDVYYVDFVAIEINWQLIVLLNIGTFLTCFFMLLLPTIIISKLTPIKTLKFD